MVHIGQEIKAVLDQQGRKISWFADKLYCDRTNVYDIFKRSSIDTELLLRISVALNFNFFSLYDITYKETQKSDNQPDNLCVK
ncbi:MAG: XRE family transcriptional regulator [Paludibacteraceae bacterium]|nr:XRE family transcriptional regulator [Paludibacteraceae bacterium]